MQPKNIWCHPIHLFAFGFGSGLLPKAPGTWGTLAAMPIYFLLAPLPLWLYFAIILIAFVMGIFICRYTTKALGVHDHGSIVWDEMVGYWLTMLMVPTQWWWILVGFILFRLFDIWKPWPINLLDKNISGGLGIMLDDVIAALYAWLMLQAMVLVV